MGATNSARMNEESRSEESDSSAQSNLEEWYGSSSDESTDVGNNYVQLLQSLISRRRMPKIRFKPNTAILDKSEFSVQTKVACGLNEVNDTDTVNVTSMILAREKGIKNHCSFSHGSRAKIVNQYLPNEVDYLKNTSGKTFCGIFSKDGNCFLTASQDRNIRLYNSGNGSYSLIQSLRARDVGWSIIDVAFSPDREHFVYTTWSSSLHICPVRKHSEDQEPLTLMNAGRRFCVFSVVFSSDGRELLGGANDGHLYIYDRHRNGRTSKIPAHEYDINSVCFADESSHIIYSGGDDGLVKVWDRRMLDERNARPVGVLAGHVDGITFIDSRGDGRHLISNSKDQSIKLWDVRVFSGEKAAERSLKAVHNQSWDYRWQEVPKKLYVSRTKLEGDTSLMTYRGHVVIKTLVRCRFSPKETTGQRYIYTGCGLGRVVVYDALTGKVVKLNNGHVGCVRDVSWHPNRTEILSSSWDGQVGKWYYKERDYMDERSDKSDESDIEDMSKEHKSHRRKSARLAAKRRKQLNSSDQFTGEVAEIKKPGR